MCIHQAIDSLIERCKKKIISDKLSGQKNKYVICSGIVFDGNLLDCDPDYYDLTFFSSSYPGFTNHLSFVADRDTMFLGTTKRIGSDFNMSEVNMATSMLSEGELLDLISIRSDAFRKIATANRLRGYLGSQHFEITHKMRSPWRLLFQYNMLETIKAN